MAKILLVDDEGSVLQSIGMLLKSDGHEVIPVRDSQQAAEVITKESYDLLITDLRMPNVDGMQLITLAHQKTPPIPSIIISAYGSEKTAQQSKALGCVAYIQKPFKIQAVTEAVRKALESK
ncbi:MAG: hypothetical protein A2283_06275 [Lentisphaerae bacterium RIFOXYA12_FULL_48_11]|nr:MAG: hypothetical protein A2283_06275 [Lentisphaerae bacterium RIFOXYA12_FULL_48_11]